MRISAVVIAAAVLLAGCVGDDDGRDVAAAACVAYEAESPSAKVTIENLRTGRDQISQAADGAASAAAQDAKWRALALAISEVLDVHDWALETASTHGTKAELWSPPLREELAERNEDLERADATVRAECRIATSS